MAISNEKLISVQHLVKRYPSRLDPSKVITALNDCNLDIMKGEYRED